MTKLKITQVRSLIRQSGPQKGTIKALGLRKINHSVVHEDTPQIRGMINKVQHLIQVDEVAE
ncbi:MAG: 50S ribosomal protein L30 [Bacteroidota bacterium]